MFGASSRLAAAPGRPTIASPALRLYVPSAETPTSSPPSKLAVPPSWVNVPVELPPMMLPPAAVNVPPVRSYVFPPGPASEPSTNPPPLNVDRAAVVIHIADAGRAEADVHAAGDGHVGAVPG